MLLESPAIAGETVFEVGLSSEALPLQASFDFYVNQESSEVEITVTTETLNIQQEQLEQEQEEQTAGEESSGIIHEPRLWCDDGWTARVIKNDDDDGWAVAMYRDGESEPALVGPWTMGRDKKNPKPLDTGAFGTLVKTASEVLRRHEQQLHAMLHKSVFVTTQTATVNVTMEIIPDEDDPRAVLRAYDEAEQLLAQVGVAPHFKLNRDSALAWIENDFRKPG